MLNYQHNQELKQYKVLDEDKTTFYYYKEKYVYVNLLSYLWFFNLCYASHIFFYNLSKWYFYGVDLTSYNDINSMIITLIWLFIGRIGFEMLIINKIKVQILDKVEIVDNKTNNKQIIRI